ncbi:hypothetical protein RRG08_014307 [Elysia crispata]|uniref:Uncharacterized protein n=1 Tax=Elysia crispata TaxID=231223 RepID=A0AAE1D8J8_9GAST|nr:hypothetical protein RRG08_014307 [Elysia crispata]
MKVRGCGNTSDKLSLVIITTLRGMHPDQSGRPLTPVQTSSGSLDQQVKCFALIAWWLTSALNRRLRQRTYLRVSTPLCLLAVDGVKGVASSSDSEPGHYMRHLPVIGSNNDLSVRGDKGNV